jgi:hypothetical protein
MTNQFVEFRIESDGRARLVASIFSQSLRPILDDPGILGYSPRDGALNQIGSNQQIDRNVLPCRNSPFQISTPRFKAVDPCFYRIAVPTQLGDCEFAAPAIIAYWIHGRRLQLIPVLAVQDLARDQIMPVGENVGVDDHRFTHNPLNGESPAVNFGRNSSNNDALSSVDW